MRNRNQYEIKACCGFCFLIWPKFFQFPNHTIRFTRPFLFQNQRQWWSCALLVHKSWSSLSTSLAEARAQQPNSSEFPNFDLISGFNLPSVSHQPSQTAATPSSAFWPGLFFEASNSPAPVGKAQRPAAELCKCMIRYFISCIINTFISYIGVLYQQSTCVLMHHFVWTLVSVKSPLFFWKESGSAEAKTSHWNNTLLAQDWHFCTCFYI